MRTLATLLEAAGRRSATEVLLESGQRVMFTTARGSEAESSPLPASDLFDMIVAAVDDAQQIELMVGNPVEFRVEADGSWMIAAQPTADGITVRARRVGVVASKAVELEPPGSFGLVELPNASDDEFEVDFEPRFDAADPAPAPAPASAKARGRLPDLDVQALDAPKVEPPETPAQSASHESGTWSLADDEEDDDDFAGFNEPIPRPTQGLAARTAPATSRHATGPQSQSSAARHPSGSHPNSSNSGVATNLATNLAVGSPLGVPHDDEDDEDPFEPFAPALEEPRRGITVAVTPTREIPRVAANVPEIAIKPDPFEPPPSASGSGSASPTRRIEAAPRKLTESPTRRELSSAEPPQRPTPRELPVQTMPERPARADVRPASELPSSIANIAEGTLVFVQEHGLADVLAEAFAAPSTTVDDSSQAEEAWARIRGLPAGAIVIVRREDPSVLLAWILRRLEEGCRVFVETRARTLEGARRTLLGVAATDRAERWLDSKVALVIEPSESGPRVRSSD
jgi:hypothetical protein